MSLNLRVKMRTLLRFGWIASAVMLIPTSGANAQQCQLNVNMPPPEFAGPYPVAWPRVGWRARTPTYPTGLPLITMSGTNSVKFVFCDVATQCSYGPGDSDFYVSQRVVMRTALENWNNSKDTNNSHLKFYEGYSALASEVFNIQFLRIEPGGMPGLDGLMHPNTDLIDTNGDGVGDTYRLTVVFVDVKSTLSGNRLTWVTAHEVGHTMALDDCPSCEAVGSIMAYPGPPDPLITSPNSCDNQQVKQTAFP